MTNLPVNTVIADIKQTLQTQACLLLQAPPGAGKTTLVPLALLDEFWLANRSILLLQPRRIAARAAATRMAQLRGERVGETIGYRIRFANKISSRTRIEVLTEGILTRRLQRDPELSGVGLVIFDEFHERSLHADLALVLCREIQSALRTDLKLLLMSATLNSNTISAWLDNAPVINSAGRSYPVTVYYAERDCAQQDFTTICRTIVRALSEQDGDLLVFLPGAWQIQQVLQRLRSEPSCAALQLLALYGDLAFEQQQQALQIDHQGRRKIVLATSIAETSLTIAGISTVIDSGFTRLPRFDPRSGLSRLETVRISADSAAQRAGRAGRLGPGACYRLWSTSTDKRLQAQQRPEILDADLSALTLELYQWGVHDAQQLRWLDKPPSAALAQAQSLLQDLQALDQHNRITGHGQQLAKLATHPRIANLLLHSERLGLQALACDLAALLEERDIIRQPEQRDSDLYLRWQALVAYRNKAPLPIAIDRNACARVQKVAQHWRKRLRIATADVQYDVQYNKQLSGANALACLLAYAYPDRIAQRRHNSQQRYLLSNGRGAYLSDTDSLINSDYLVAAQLDAGRNEGRIYLAAALDAADLEHIFSARISSRSAIAWHTREQAVHAQVQRCLGKLIISEKKLDQPDQTLLNQAMLSGVAQMGLTCLPWTDVIRQWQARVLSLRRWFPEQHWPDVSDPTLAATLTQWLLPYLNDCTRREHLQRLALTEILQAQLDWQQQTRLTQLAPSHMQVPSGSRLRLHYSPDAAPILAVKLQEMFGLADTPRICHGRIKIMLHLLSPAQRPIQITQDLKGFWQNTYPQVKKELKGRYPKHPWPDDPWQATATRYSKKRTLKNKS